MTDPADPIRLTQYSHGAGCGCKISPAVLEEILSAAGKTSPHAQLLVGNDSKDDAAVYDLGNGQAVISTTDFFMPIVDDPFDFGQIASVNAISDIYAMGGTPLMAIAILGWPLEKLRPPSPAKSSPAAAPPVSAPAFPSPVATASMPPNPSLASLSPAKSPSKISNATTLPCRAVNSSLPNPLASAS